MRCFGLAICFLFFTLYGLHSITLAQAPGAAKAPPAKSPYKQVRFAEEIMPLFSKAGCNAASCHGSETGAGNLKLSLFGAYAEDDYPAITRCDGGRLINKIAPSESRLLAKISGKVPHKGGVVIKANSPDYELLKRWIWEGARIAPTQKAVRGVVPVKLFFEGNAQKSITLTKGATYQPKVFLEYSDGSKKDVTTAAIFRSNQPDVITCESNPAKIMAKQYGQGFVVATYLRKSGLLEVVIPHKLAGAYPGDPAPPAKNAASAKLDALVLAKLKQLGIKPAPLCSDSEFLRRVCLDVMGVLPTPTAARKFLADKSPDKRAKFINALFARAEYADYWAMRWSDLLRVKSEFPSNLWPNATWSYHNWIRDQITNNRPYDEFVRDLLTSSGSNFRVPPVNYYRAFSVRKPEAIGETTALVLMGARLSCSRCHAHPTEEWDRKDNAGMAAFFANVSYKSTQEWKEEIVFTKPLSRFNDPITKLAIPPKPLGEEAFPTPQMGEDTRKLFADWLITPENPYFAKNISNRIWFWLFGHGIISPVDDVRPTNPPLNAELLDFLAAELVKSDWDLQHLYKTILLSNTYQRSAYPSDGVGDGTYFSRYRPRRLPAEVLLDAISKVTMTNENLVSRVPEPYTYVPRALRTVQVADASITNAPLALFGKPSRNTAYESGRDCTTSVRQALHLLNSNHIQGKVAAGKRLPSLFKSGKTDPELVEELFLLTLTRVPSQEEKKATLDHIKNHKGGRTRAFQDLFWALINTKEFIFNH